MPARPVRPAGPLNAIRVRVLVLALLTAASRSQQQQSPEFSSPKCPRGTQHAWLQHCASAPDCTSEGSFCACCKAYGLRSEWAEACTVFCGDKAFEPDRISHAEKQELASRTWRLDDFGVDGPAGPTSDGPLFEQPALSLTGDAAVVIGDCYNIDVRAQQQLNRAGESLGTTACLVPPVTRKLYGSDMHISLNLSVCPSTDAPWHVHDPQPAALAAMLCFDECHVRNVTRPVEPPPVVDHGALFIANCTRRCFASCVRPLAADCSSGCDAANYSCFGECHLRAQTCSVPMGPRDLRTFRRDPNAVECVNEYSRYEACVQQCSDGCHEELTLSRRTVFDDIDDWFNASCSPPLAIAAEAASSCLNSCQGNCSSYCNETVTFPLGPLTGLGPALSNCTRNCTDYCLEEVCFTDEMLYEYESGCRPPIEYNCSADCFGDVCIAEVVFCSVYDVDGQLRHVDKNCSFGFNVTYQPQWGNASVAGLLEDPASELSVYLGINGTSQICYNDCNNISRMDQGGDEFFFHGSVMAVGLNCTSTCYSKACVSSCVANCTRDEEIAALPPCPGAGTADCLTPYDCAIATLWGNCSASKAFDPVLINITAITENVTVWVPNWDQGVCEDSTDQAISAFRACAGACRELCEVLCPLPGNVSYEAGIAVIRGSSDAEIIQGVLVNDTSGLCLQQCHAECSANCSASLVASVTQYWCTTPSEPIDWCFPPPNCTSDCGHECLDPTLLLATDPECEEYKYMKAADGGNLSVVALPLSFNVSSPPLCSRNVTLLGGVCTDE